MSSKRIMSIGGAVALACAAGAAVAASDYLLQLDGVKGEAASPETIEVLSWSWGASNPTSVGSSGMSSGKAAAAGGSVQSAAVSSDIKAPRDVATGQASGKRQHKPVTVISSSSTAVVGGASAPSGATVAEPKMGDMATVTVMVRESPTLRSMDKASPMLAKTCASGQHISVASLSGKGRSYQMHDVVVSNCSVEGDRRKVELKGHVTLIR